MKGALGAPVIGFAGMTHLGIVSSVAAAARGFGVVGYDSDGDLVARLQRGEMPVVEPDLVELHAAHRDRISFTAEAGDLGRCDVVYIAADVPTDDEGKSDLTPIGTLIDRVTRQLCDTAILVILCQVPPGFTRAVAAVPYDRLIYQVETLVFGRAVERALNPERVIVGCADPKTALPTRYREILEAFGCPILPMRYESAELAKISINFCLVASVTVANVLAELSESIGADWAEIVPALKLDRRIGAHSYLNPGLGLAGGNLERDLRTVIDLAAGTGTDIGVVHAWIANSRHRRDWCWRLLRDRVLCQLPKARIAILGLAYKEHTHSVKNSASLALLARLRGFDVRVHDPAVPAAIMTSAVRCAEPLECAEGADVLVLATPWPEYRQLRIADLVRVMAGRVVLDPFRLLDPSEATAAGFEYYALGMPPRAPATSHYPRC
jgi:UDPglucose 6-dehydrogenase